MNKSSDASLLRKLAREHKEIMEEFRRYLDSIYGKYEDRYPEIVACLRKAMRARNIGEIIRFQNKADELIRKQGAEHLWELKI